MRKPIPASRSAARFSEPYCPDSGDLIWLDFDPQAGREQAGRRPALVLSPRRYNDVTSLCVLCPVTSGSKDYPFEVALGGDGPITGVVLSDHVKNLSWEARNAAFAVRASVGVLADVKAKVAALLQIV
jgi:mRNA interferase MazF